MNFNRMTSFECDYASLVNYIMYNGHRTKNRTSINSRTVFGNNTLRHDCLSFFDGDLATLAFEKCPSFSGDAVIPEDAEMLRDCYQMTICPILLGRPIRFDIAWYETIMMLKGITDTTYLEDRNIRIWKGNTTREFLDNRGLTDTPEKDLGKGYGYQWRNWNGRTDQLKIILDQMINNPESRRHVVSAWNPEENSEAALDPCHILYQFNVEEQENGDMEVDIQFYMRSSDVVFGLPFNMLGYYIILCIVCGFLTSKTGQNWNPRNVYYTGANSHIYENQIEFTSEYLDRIMKYEMHYQGCPTLVLDYPAVSYSNFDDYLHFIEEKGYRLFYDKPEKLSTPQPKMAV